LSGSKRTETAHEETDGDPGVVMNENERLLYELSVAAEEFAAITNERVSPFARWNWSERAQRAADRYSDAHDAVLERMRDD
jgi:hypothetical protein